MKKKSQLKYVYIEPKTKEEKEEQQKTIDDVFVVLFEELAKKRR